MSLDPVSSPCRSSSWAACTAACAPSSSGSAGSPGCSRRCSSSTSRWPPTRTRNTEIRKVSIIRKIDRSGFGFNIEIKMGIFGIFHSLRRGPYWKSCGGWVRKTHPLFLLGLRDNLFLFLREIFYFRDVISPGPLQVSLKTPGIANIRWSWLQIMVTITQPHSH